MLASNLACAFVRLSGQWTNGPGASCSEVCVNILPRSCGPVFGCKAARCGAWSFACNHRSGCLQSMQIARLAGTYALERKRVCSQAPSSQKALARSGAYMLASPKGAVPMLVYFQSTAKCQAFVITCWHPLASHAPLLSSACPTTAKWRSSGATTVKPGAAATACASSSRLCAAVHA